MDAPNPTSLWLSFQRRSRLSAERTALHFEGRKWTYAQMAEAIERLAAVLYAQGLRQGDRVGHLGFNRPECLFTLFAAAALGVIFVPLNFRLTSPELKFLVHDADIHTLLVGPEHLDLIEPLRSELPCRSYIQIGGDAPGWLSLAALLQAAPPAAPVADVKPDDVATLVYTSGTTGTPKGAMLTHANLWHNNINWILCYGISSDDRLLTTAPMFHVGGLFVLLSPVLLVGGEVVLHRGFEAGAVLAALQEHRVTMTFSVPTMMLMLSQHPAFDGADLSHLRLLVVGGAPSPESLLRRYAGRGIAVSHTYGMSEVVSFCTFLETASGMKKLNSAGRAAPLSELMLIDAGGQPITEPGIKGEICVRGPTVMAGYWRRAEATASACSADGWFRTGDIGSMDAEGYLFVNDRLKDMVISGGENVYPAEVESALLEHPGIAQAAVIGRPDAQWGERVCAVLVLKAGATLTLEDLQAFCAPRLARYKTPKELKLVEQLPLSGAGKVLKQVLRQTLG
jgi:fatty-acyl-CoA synthase